MSWSLELRNGDFQVRGAQFNTTIRQRKLIQDLRCALLEKMGTDNLHPSFGALIDGGRTPDGVEVPGVIGMNDIDLAVLEIESDITRIVREHQRRQLSRAKQDRLVYGRATLDPEEVLLELTGIDFNQDQDQILVTINILTATDDSFEVTLPLGLDLQDIA